MIALGDAQQLQTQQRQKIEAIQKMVKPPMVGPPSLALEELMLDMMLGTEAFDPLAEPSPDLEAPLEERPLGGLGLTLVRALVQEAHYVRDGSTNVLRLRGC